MPLTVRRATLADAPAIAEVHVAAWRETYTGIVPAPFLADLKAERREKMWREVLSSADQPPMLHVAVDDTGRIVGFASAGANRSPELGFSGELYAIYLLQAHQGEGTGRRLFQAVVSDLRAAGHTGMMLWVIDQNRTVDFYKHLGGIERASKIEEIGGAPLTELALGWPSLPF